MLDNLRELSSANLLVHFFFDSYKVFVFVKHVNDVPIIRCLNGNRLNINWFAPYT